MKISNFIVCVLVIACIPLCSCTEYNSEILYKIVPKVFIGQEGKFRLVVKSEKCESRISMHSTGRRTAKITNCVENKNDNIEWRFGKLTKIGATVDFEINQVSPKTISVTIEDNGVMYSAQEHIEEIEKIQGQSKLLPFDKF